MLKYASNLPSLVTINDSMFLIFLSLSHGTKALCAAALLKKSWVCQHPVVKCSARQTYPSKASSRQEETPPYHKAEDNNRHPGILSLREVVWLQKVQKGTKKRAEHEGQGSQTPSVTGLCVILGEGKKG